MNDISKSIMDAKEIKEIARKTDAIGVDTVESVCNNMCNRLIKMMYSLLEEKHINEKQEITLDCNAIKINRRLELDAVANTRLRTLIQSLHLGKVNEQETLRGIKYERFGNHIACSMRCVYDIQVGDRKLAYDMCWIFNSIEKMWAQSKEIETIDKVISSLVIRAYSDKVRVTSAEIAEICRETIEATNDKYSVTMKFIDLYNNIFDEINKEAH